MLTAQEQALVASARAVSLRLAADQSLRLSENSVSASDRPVYFHALQEAPLIDGFDDEWRHFQIRPAAMPIQPAVVPLELGGSGSGAEQQGDEDDNLQAQLYAGFYRGLIYIFMRIPDDSPQYLNPALDPLRSGDYLRVLRESQPDLYLGVSAPGNVTARYLDGGQIRPEYGMAGVWNHTGDEYLIELRIRPRLLDQAIGIEFLGMDIAGNQTAFRQGLVNAEPLPFISADIEIAEALNVFAGDGLRLSVIDTEGWLLAQAGDLDEVPADYSGQNGLLRRLYQIILQDTEVPPLEQWHRQGRLDAAGAASDLTEDSWSARFRYGDRKVGRSSLPIVRDGLAVGVVVAEQTSDSLTTSTNTAFNRLLFWSLLSMLLVGVGLLFFASLLSFRIRKLSKAADVALDDRGNLHSDFPVSAFNDEVGDLSRSFDQLLTRLRDYTDYLRTLSGKLSHELKTPLAIVRSSLDNLEQQDLTAEARTYTDRASDGASRLSAIFQALSGASRLEESVQGAEIENVDLVDLMQAVSAAYKDAYREAKICVSIASDSGPMHLKAAPELIVQMLDKLVDNAVGFCAENGAVELALFREGEEAVLTVSNDGPVLPEEMKGQLFDSLVSVRQATSDQIHLGLGLYVARLITEGHGGRIYLDNKPDGTGVTASVHLPLVSASTV